MFEAVKLTTGSQRQEMKSTTSGNLTNEIKTNIKRLLPICL
jgi:hypothetical protein